MREKRKDIKIFTNVEFDDRKNTVYESSNFVFIVGKSYTVSYISDHSFIIKDENGSYTRDNDGNPSFISLSEFREQQLNKLLL
jgi:hypothetical protein